MKCKSCLLLLTFFICTTFAKADKLPDPTPYFSALIVNNLDDSCLWYVEKLGFEVLNKVDMPARGFKQANLKRGAALIELIETNKTLKTKEILKDKPKKTKIAGFFKFGFSVNQFDDWVAHLANLEVDMYGTVVKDNLSGKKMVIILDPDGNRIQLFEK